MKGIQLQPVHFDIWVKKILEDYKKGLDLKKGFEKLESEKAFGGLDYAVFFDGAKINDEEIIEKEWQECLAYAKTNSGKVSARAAKALNSFGGMQYLKDSPKDEINWSRKNFIEAYKNTQDPIDLDFRCPGIEQDKIYFKNDEKKLLEATR